MEIQIKLMGVLKSKTPADGRLTSQTSMTIGDALDQLDIPRTSVQVFTVNGTLERDQSRQLNEGDELTVLPPVGGG